MLQNIEALARATAPECCRRPGLHRRMALVEDDALEPKAERESPPTLLAPDTDAFLGGSRGEPSVWMGSQAA